MLWFSNTVRGALKQYAVKKTQFKDYSSIFFESMLISHEFVRMC